jgi:hypothetical protein
MEPPQRAEGFAEGMKVRVSVDRERDLFDTKQTTLLGFLCYHNTLSGKC